MGTYVVTGAAGYIGSVLCKKLKEHGHKVISVDLKPNKPKYADMHLEETFEHPAITHTIIDRNVDGIFHLAAHSLLGPSVTDPLSYFDNNASRTNTFLHDLISYGWHNKLVFSSTAATYGEQASMVNELSPQIPINPYGMSKLHAEQIIQSAHDAFGLDAVIFRFFNVSGADGDVGQDRNEPHILTQMSKAKLNGQKFHIYGSDYNTKDGTCIRDYVHVVDVANAHLLAMDLLHQNPGIHKFNLGTSHGTSNLELLNTFKDITGEDLDYDIVERRPGDPAYLVADASRFTQATGYTFPHSHINNIIASQWDWYNQ